MSGMHAEGSGTYSGVTPPHRPITSGGVCAEASSPTRLATAGHSAIVGELAKSAKSLEPLSGFEPETYGLRNRSESSDSKYLDPNMANPWPTDAIEAAKALLRDIADGHSIMPARAFALADTVLQSEVAEAARAVHSAESRFLLRRVIQDRCHRTW